MDRTGIKGQFQRMSTQFHHWITADGSSGFKAESGRYHLYILGCPWAHRTAILWKLKGLETTIGLSIVNQSSLKQGWQFSDYPGVCAYGLTRQTICGKCMSSLIRLHWTGYSACVVG